MNFGSKFPVESSGFQMAPMIDVIFLLLLFFMSASVFTQIESEMEITIPEASEAAPMDRAPSEIIINVRRSTIMTVLLVPSVVRNGSMSFPS